jgi:hypothetical protein
MQTKKISLQRHRSFVKQTWEKADFAKLTLMLALPHTFTVKNSLELALELTQFPITETHKPVTFDITDLYVNLPITDLITTTKFWLHKANTPAIIIQHLVSLVTAVLHQNYFHFDGNYYKLPQVLPWGHRYLPPWPKFICSTLRRC